MNRDILKGFFFTENQKIVRNTKVRYKLERFETAIVESNDEEVMKRNAQLIMLTLKKIYDKEVLDIESKHERGTAEYNYQMDRAAKRVTSRKSQSIERILNRIQERENQIFIEQVQLLEETSASDPRYAKKIKKVDTICDFIHSM